LANIAETFQILQLLLIHYNLYYSQ